MPQPDLSALKDDIGTLPLSDDYLPAVMQALHYYTEMMQYELVQNPASTTLRPKPTTKRPITTTKKITTTPKTTTTKRTTTTRSTTRKTTTTRTTTQKPTTSTQRPFTTTTTRKTTVAQELPYYTEINILCKFQAMMSNNHLFSERF